MKYKTLLIQPRIESRQRKSNNSSIHPTSRIHPSNSNSLYNVTMELIKKIKGLSFPEVRNLLTNSPYKLLVKESVTHPNLYLITYNPRSSGFSEPFVSNCRGIVLEKDTNKIVGYPFDKFWNYNENTAAPVDVANAKVQEKLDGSLIKVYWYEPEQTWIVGTSGTIDAKDAKVGKANIKNFYEIFISCWEETWSATGNLEPAPPFPFDQLNMNYTYMFEAMHPATMVVVRHDRPRLVHIGTRDNISLLELNPDDTVVPHVPRPPTFPAYTTMQALQEAASTTFTDPFSMEGFVVVDQQFRRVKVKTLAYVMAHNGPGPRRKKGYRVTVEDEKLVMFAVLNGETSEMAAYYPNLEPRMKKVKEMFENAVKDFGTAVQSLWRRGRKARGPEAVMKEYFLGLNESYSHWFTVLEALYKSEEGMRELLGVEAEKKTVEQEGENSATELVRNMLVKTYKRNGDQCMELLKLLNITFSAKMA